jgi:D-glycero-alpha-D-manno-heptose-7-phosphate kinase
VHQKVIADLEREGGTAPRLEGLRQTAEKSRDALYAGDFAALGRVMAENTDLQTALHPDLVGADARAVIELAKAHGAVGWKVNGAGGEGGSVTLLCGASAGERRRLVRAVSEANPLYQPIPIYLSRFGLRVWEA